MPMKLQNLYKKINLNIILILLIPLILNINWFREGNIMGTAESGLPFYNPQLQYDINKDAWAYYALGHPINIGSAAIPAYWFFAHIQNLGIPGFVLQAIFFWLILVVSGGAIYKLVREIFPNIDWLHGLLAVLFYWFNPFSLVNVWNRFLNNFFVFYALLPLTVYLFIKGLHNRKYIYAILIGLVSALFSYALTSIVFVLMLLGIIFYIGFFHFIVRKDDRFFTIKFFLLAFLFWYLANLWWISQIFSYLQLGSFNAVANTSFNTGNNYNTFSLLSERLGMLIYIFRLKHATFFNNTEQFAWIGIYLSPIIIFLEFLVTGIFLLPLILKKKNIYITMFGSLLLISIFLAKGNNPPLGEIFDRAFLNISPLQLFRNPLEKIGFILAFSASILFAIGSLQLEKLLNIKWRLFARSLIFVWILVIWGFPFWTGLVFTSSELPTNKLDAGYQVKVPASYKDASKWLNSQTGNFRLAVLPIGGEGITYLWNLGYSGVELSNQILPRTSVSFNTNIPFYNEISNDLERLFLTRDNISKIIDVLNIKYVLLRSDIDWKIRKMRDPASLNSRLKEIASMSALEKVKEFDRLAFWEYTKWKDRSIYLTNNLIKSGSANPIEDILNVDFDKPSALYNSQTPINDKLIKTEIIHPDFKFGIGEKNLESKIILRDDIIFPAIRVLPSSVLYPLVLIKERLETDRISDKRTLIIKKISLLGKRLVEVDKELTLNDYDGAIEALEGYSKQIQELYQYRLGDNPNKKEAAIFLQEDLYQVFLRHSKMLSHLAEVFSKSKQARVVQVQKILNDFMLNDGIEPLFGYLEKPNYSLTDRTIYQFSVDKEGSYELLFNIRNWNDFFKVPYGEPAIFQIDNNIVFRQGELQKNGVLSFGFLNLTPGKHEIGWNVKEQINQVEAPPEFSVNVEHGISERAFPIKNLDPYSAYVLSLNYLIKKGGGIQVSFEGNNDPSKKGIIQRQLIKNLTPDSYDFNVKSYTTDYHPVQTSDSVNLIFDVYPWNNCSDIFWTNNKKRCEDEKFRRAYDRMTDVAISNVSLVKSMTEAPFLRLEKESGNENLPNISFNKINGAVYKVDIKNAGNKYALILSELYDPAWKLLKVDGGDISDNHFLANGYANGWIIDRRGNYQMIIKFTPEDLLKKTQKVSLIVIIFGAGLIGLTIISAKTKNEEE